MSTGHRQPAAFVIGAEDHPGRKAHAKRKPRAVTGIEFEPDDAAGDLVVVAPAPVPPSRRWRWGTMLVSSLAALAILWSGLAIVQLVEDVFARSTILGSIALGLAGLAGLAALAIVIREIWALARLRRIETIQADAAHAINIGDVEAGARAQSGLKRIYGSRADSRWGLQQLRQYDNDIVDVKQRMALFDRYLLAPRDEESHRIIARAARRVTLLTTVTPAAALDILFVGAQNLRMIREIASLYGGRPSSLSTIRLARMVLGHLAVAGGLALSDSLLQHLVGRGLVGRLSARFGEGAVNGILTARIGLAARDVCRPIPQQRGAKESLGSLLKELVSSDEGTPERK